MSLARPLGGRVPFLDYRVVELCVPLPMNSKIADGQTKRVVRGPLHWVGLHQIAERRDKKGYPTRPLPGSRLATASCSVKILPVPGARIHEFCDRHRLARLIECMCVGSARLPAIIFIGWSAPRFGCSNASVR